MSQSQIKTPCEECGEEFNPYLNRKKGWTCPNCKTRQPNLALHYRIIAYLCGAALAWTLLGLTTSVINTGHLASVHYLPAAQSVFMLLSLSLITFGRQPWRNNVLTSVLCLVFLSFAIFYFLCPALLLFGLNVTASYEMLRFIIIFGVLVVGIGAYLGWVYLAIRRLQLANRD